MEKLKAEQITSFVRGFHFLLKITSIHQVCLPKSKSYLNLIKYIKWPILTCHFDEKVFSNRQPLQVEILASNWIEVAYPGTSYKPWSKT